MVNCYQELELEKKKRKAIFLKYNLNVLECNILHKKRTAFFYFLVWGGISHIFLTLKDTCSLIEISKIQKSIQKKNSFHKTTVLVYNSCLGSAQFFYTILITWRSVKIKECPKAVGNQQRLLKMSDKIKNRRNISIRGIEDTIHNTYRGTAYSIQAAMFGGAKEKYVCMNSENNSKWTF